MATDILSDDVSTADEPPRPVRHMSTVPLIDRILRPLASLRLTVTLFGLAIFLVLAGTLAQTTHDISWVLNHYFRAPLAWIELRVYFPPAWWADYPGLQNLTSAFPFPGGFTIGGLMALNLLACAWIALPYTSQRRPIVDRRGCDRGGLRHHLVCDCRRAG